MKKGFIFVLIFLTFFTSLEASFTEIESAERFMNSPNFSEIDYIKDLEIRYCEEVFLEAYRRREFSEEENFICKDFFAQKIEDELNYKKIVLSARGVY